MCGLCVVCVWFVCGVCVWCVYGLCVVCVCGLCVWCGVCVWWCVRVSIIALGVFPHRYLDDNTYVDKSKEL